MKKLTAFGNVNNGVLKIRNRRVFDSELNTLSGEVKITIETDINKRSSPQNRYYWGVIVPLVKSALNDLGNDINTDDTHEFLKSKFNPKNVIFQDTGETFEYGASTTEMDIEDFMIYIDKIQRFCAEYLNLEIPDPIHF